MNLLGTWLTDRMDLQLHLYQLKILIRVVKVRNSHMLLLKSLWVHWLFKQVQSITNTFLGSERGRLFYMIFNRVIYDLL